MSTDGSSKGKKTAPLSTPQRVRENRWDQRLAAAREKRKLALQNRAMAPNGGLNRSDSPSGASEDPVASRELPDILARAAATRAEAPKRKTTTGARAELGLGATQRVVGEAANAPVPPRGAPVAEAMDHSSTNVATGASTPSPDRKRGFMPLVLGFSFGSAVALGLFVAATQTGQDLFAPTPAPELESVPEQPLLAEAPEIPMNTPAGSEVADDGSFQPEIGISPTKPAPLPFDETIGVAMQSDIDFERSGTPAGQRQPATAGLPVSGPGTNIVANPPLRPASPFVITTLPETDAGLAEAPTAPAPDDAAPARTGTAPIMPTDLTSLATVAVVSIAPSSFGMVAPAEQNEIELGGWRQDAAPTLFGETAKLTVAAIPAVVSDMDAAFGPPVRPREVAISNSATLAPDTSFAEIGINPRLWPGIEMFGPVTFAPQRLPNPETDNIGRLERGEAPIQIALPRQEAVVLHVLIPGGVAEEQAADIRFALNEIGYDLRSPAPVAITMRRSQVRYYHAADAAAADIVGEIMGVTVRDFTSFTPQPAEGTVEFWLAGDAGAAAPSPPRQEPVARAVPPPPPQPQGFCYRGDPNDPNSIRVPILNGRCQWN